MEDKAEDVASQYWSYNGFIYRWFGENGRLGSEVEELDEASEEEAQE